MQDLAALKVKSILLTSGTLSPMESFAYELKMPFPIRLENPHVISNEQVRALARLLAIPNCRDELNGRDLAQVWVGVVDKGPSGYPLNSSFKSRDDHQYKVQLRTLPVD